MKTNALVLTAGQKDTAGCVSLKWTDPQTGQERIPLPRKTTYPLLTGFSAAGRHYLHLRLLLAKQIGPMHYRDVYGRDVICLKELFPCFDSYDYLYENRYYRWYFLFCDGKLTMVYYADTAKSLDVTEDVDRIKAWQWEELEKFPMITK